MGSSNAQRSAQYVLLFGMIALASSSVGFAKYLPVGKTATELPKKGALQSAPATQQPATNRLNVAQVVANLQNGMNKLYVYDFTASWCPNCTAIKPMLHELNNRYRDHVQLVEIDTENAKIDQLVDQFAVQKLPTILVIRPNGTIAARYVGRDEAKQLDAELSSEVSKMTKIGGPTAKNKGIQSY